ncbi:MAG: tryptophan synthase subunit alpha [candidate division KSB1 bacterium]|nr:tryptophan synthase subunit alpha [candidate division KSB1 bacterium]
MNRLEKKLQGLRQTGEKAAVFFVTAGDPSLTETLAVMEAMADAGADVIELGVPFSDPIADGPVIQRSTQRALAQNVTLPAIFSLVEEFRRQRQTPLVLMGYYNPLLRYGLRRAMQDAARAGLDGVIIADLPYEEGEEAEDAAQRAGLSLIYLLAPEIDPERTRAILHASSGFVYCVSHYGTTGEKSGGGELLPETVRMLKSMTDLPVLLGFGISSPDDVREKAAVADGVIIGSWLIRTLEAAENRPQAAAEFVRAVKRALKPGA